MTVGNTVNDDSLSYDIFSQAGQACSDSPAGVDPLHGSGADDDHRNQRVAVRRSASRSMRTRFSVLADLYDGMLMLSTIGQRVRQDLSTPVFKVLTEFDVTGFNEANVRQNDTTKFRTWEVAGTSHVDQHLRDSREPLELRDNGVSTKLPIWTRRLPPGVGSNPSGLAFQRRMYWPPPTHSWCNGCETAPAADCASYSDCRTFGNPSVPVRNF